MARWAVAPRTSNCHYHLLGRLVCLHFKSMIGQVCIEKEEILCTAQDQLYVNQWADALGH